jgi:hypothetical protein
VFWCDYLCLYLVLVAQGIRSSTMLDFYDGIYLSESILEVICLNFDWICMSEMHFMFRIHMSEMH